jgi:hypothetical protein
MGIVRRLIRTFFGNAKGASLLNKCAAQSKAKIFTTIEESQDNKFEAWNHNQDIIEGLEFCATMQLRTPLRVLLRHGEIHTDINSEPPKIAMEMWEGIWVIKSKPWSELGIDLSELPPPSYASAIGPIHAEDYLPFLITVRKVVELDDSIEVRINILREKSQEVAWKIFVEKHGGIDKIIGYFFPEFIYTIPKINDATIAELTRLNLDTPNRIAGAPDKTLLSIKGIGQAKLKTIREYCTGIANSRDAKRFDNVTR